jgi:hypothetical protein
MKAEEEPVERRMNVDRRQFHYSFHIPERRVNGERRKSDPCIYEMITWHGEKTVNEASVCVK